MIMIIIILTIVMFYYYYYHCYDYYYYQYYDYYYHHHHHYCSGPPRGGRPSARRAPGRACRRRVNMVGVNMVLVEFVKFKHGLYRSCGTECFEGILLEPCSLQPCLHVAGPAAQRRT